ncbi:MAG: sigma-70 family RNA polymerase sigma factor [Balneolales bacterium]
MPLITLLILASLVRNDSGDRELALRIGQGDKEAFRAFFDKYERPLISFLMSKGISREDAEDLVQNAFMIIWDKRDKLLPGRSLKSFLFTIAYRRMLNLFRDRKDHNPEFAYALADTGQLPDASSETKQAMQAMQQALEVMPEKRRQVFELCYLQELSYREASEVLGVAVKTIENHMACALKDLRVALKSFIP